MNEYHYISTYIILGYLLLHETFGQLWLCREPICVGMYVGTFVLAALRVYTTPIGE